jgi:hypothetical protein
MLQIQGQPVMAFTSSMLPSDLNSDGRDPGKCGEQGWAVRTSHIVALRNRRIETGYVQHLDHVHRYFVGQLVFCPLSIFHFSYPCFYNNSFIDGA